MKDKQKILDSIREQGILPLFYWDDADVSLKTMETMYRAGVRAVEYTNRGAAALDNFIFMKKALSVSAPDMYLGIGTIKTVSDAESFIAAGADFIVAPIVNPDVAVVAKKAGLLWVPGCMTPTEIFQAQQHGAALIKIFPANILGPAFVSSIKELFQGQLFIPTGGVEIVETNIRAWKDAGVCAVGMGSKLVSKAVLTGQQYEQLYNDTVKALSITRAVFNDKK